MSGSTAGEEKLTIINTKVVEGEQQRTKTGDTISMHYRGTLKQGGKEFDANLEGKKPPLTFVLGVGQVIKGWDEGLQNMAVGEKRTLIIHPDKAYADKGFFDLIPAHATLVFETELVKIVPR